jgi:hypothetical protein
MRQLNLGLRLRASKVYLKTILFAARPGSPANEKSVLGAATTRGAREEIAAHGHGHLRAWTWNPFTQTRMNTRCVASHGGSSRAAAATGRCKEREHGAHRHSFSSVIVRYSPSNKTSPVPSLSPSSCSFSSASSSVRTSSRSSDGGVGPTLRRSSSASSEVENPVQGLIAYCKRS